MDWTGSLIRGKPALILLLAVPLCSLPMIVINGLITNIDLNINWAMHSLVALPLQYQASRLKKTVFPLSVISTTLPPWALQTVEVLNAHILCTGEALTSLITVIYYSRSLCLSLQREWRRSRRWILISRTGTMATHWALQGNCLGQLVKLVASYFSASRQRERTQPTSSPTAPWRSSRSRSNSLGATSRSELLPQW